MERWKESWMRLFQVLALELRRAVLAVERAQVRTQDPWEKPRNPRNRWICLIESF